MQNNNIEAHQCCGKNQQVTHSHKKSQIFKGRQASWLLGLRMLLHNTGEFISSITAYDNLVGFCKHQTDWYSGDKTKSIKNN